jgi:hypothetical protein
MHRGAKGSETGEKGSPGRVEILNEKKYLTSFYRRIRINKKRRYRLTEFTAIFSV